MANPWTKLVQEKFRLGRMTNNAYTLKEAMKSAKLVYKSASATVSKTIGKKRKSRGGKTPKRKSRKSRR